MKEKDLEIIDEEFEETKKPSDMGFLTLFIIMFPSLIIAMAGAITSPLTKIGIQVVVLFMQLIIVKSFIDDYQKIKG